VSAVHALALMLTGLQRSPISCPWRAPAALIMPCLAPTGGTLTADGTPYYAIRRGRYKLILGDPGQAGIVDAYYCTGPPCPGSHDNQANASAAPRLSESSLQLFDLVADPFEATPLPLADPAVALVAAELHARLETYNSSAVSSAQQGLPDDPAAAPALHNGTLAPWRG
jgi:hypothetical protein